VREFRSETFSHFFSVNARYLQNSPSPSPKESSVCKNERAGAASRLGSYSQEMLLCDEAGKVYYMKSSPGLLVWDGRMEWEKKSELTWRILRAARRASHLFMNTEENVRTTNSKRKTSIHYQLILSFAYLPFPTVTNPRVVVSRKDTTLKLKYWLHKCM